MRLLANLYNLAVYGKEKAVVAFAVSGALSLLALVGVTGDMTVKQVLTALGTAIVTHAAVYAKTNNL